MLIKRLNVNGVVTEYQNQRHQELMKDMFVMNVWKGDFLKDSLIGLLGALF